MPSGGLVYEYDPRTGTTPPRPAVGARSHEGLRFDAQGNLYGISASTPGVNGSGALYKFVPDRRGDLSSGQLYVLKVLDASRTGEAVWVPLDREAVQVNSDAAAIAAGATGWGRPEDIEISTSSGNTKGGNIMYVASTSEDLVLRIELNGDEAYVSNFVQEGVNVRGNERVASEVVLFASLSDCAGEPTGFYFDRNGKTALVHVQHAGGTLRNDLLVAITKD